MAQARADISRARGAVRRLRNAVGEALPVLAALEELTEVPDHIGRYTVAPGENLDEDELLDFLRLARSHNPNGAMEIVVFGRTEELQVTGRQATHERNTHDAGAAGAAAGRDVA